MFGLPRKCLGFSVGPPSVLVLVWSPKCLGFSVGPPSVLVVVWGQYYTGFSIGGSDMDPWGLG